MKTPFLSKPKPQHITIDLISKKKFKPLETDEPFEAGSKAIALQRNAKGKVTSIAAAMDDSIKIHDMAKIADAIRAALSRDVLKSCSFEIKATGFKKADILNAHVGWGLAQYVFDPYKKSNKAAMKLVWHKNADQKRVKADIEASTLLRNLINIPANDLGPQELEDAAAKVAEAHKAKLKIIKGATLEKGFPLIHTVGKASPRAPRLIELNWGKAKDPKLVFIGKGVVFDTGGLDIKPSQYMRLMKKDMGGAAHALALAQMIMALKVPVNLRLLIPAVENAVGGAAFRPGDIIRSRKGLTVENTNTDAEGRLILADALSYGSEDKPDLVIDFATLTGSARAALGQDIPAMFSNNDRLATQLQKLSFEADDPLWAMPLWTDYHRHIESPIADLVNSAGLPGDLIYSALFLQKFLEGTPDWIHLDLFAWEPSGRPGRAKGGTEMGLRACLSLIEERYG